MIILQNTRLGITTLELLLNYGVSAYSKDSAPFRHWHQTVFDTSQVFKYSNKVSNLKNNSKGGKR